MIFVFLQEFLAGTLHISAFFFVLYVVVIILLFAMKSVNKIITRVNRVHITRAHPLFKFNYVALVGIVVIIIITVILAALKDQRGEFWFFMTFSFFAFFAGAIALGLLLVSAHILKVGEYRLGNGILLLLGAALFGMAGVNVHDVLWCGSATNWFQVERIGGYDLQAWFSFFQILDSSNWDYRIMGFYMIFQASLEAFTAFSLFHKFFLINAGGFDSHGRRRVISTYLLCFSAVIVLGVVEFAFDSPWYFSNLQYYLILFTGIPVVATLFIIAGLSLPEKGNEYS